MYTVDTDIGGHFIIMGTPVSGINPEILIWSRKRAGYSIDDVAQKMNKDAAIIVSWEAGEAAPTYPQLEKLAYTIYKRPIALFFFPQPPDEPDMRQSFRTLPHEETDKFAPDTLYALRTGQALQLTLSELNDGVNPGNKKIFRDIELQAGVSVTEGVTAVRAYLGIDIDEQMAWHNTTDALKAWRVAVQDNGIFVFKRSFKQKEISGFCLYDIEFPIIYLNNSTTESRQIFTLFHELAHLLLHNNGVTQVNTRYINTLQGDAREIEIFCNRFASEFLVPTEHFNAQLSPSMQINDQSIRTLANKYNISREVILRRLLDKQLITSAYYQAKVKEWMAEYHHRKDSKKGKSSGHYYNTQLAYFGDHFLNMVFDRYYSNRISMPQIADYLNMKVPTVMKLEEQMMDMVARQ